MAENTKLGDAGCFVPGVWVLFDFGTYSLVLTYATVRRFRSNAFSGFP